MRLKTTLFKHVHNCSWEETKPFLSAINNEIGIADLEKLYISLVTKMPQKVKNRFSIFGFQNESTDILVTIAFPIHKSSIWKYMEIEEEIKVDLDLSEDMPLPLCLAHCINYLYKDIGASWKHILASISESKKQSNKKAKVGTFGFYPINKINKDNPYKWTYWLKDNHTVYDEKTKCGTVYKSSLSEEDRSNIQLFREEFSVTLNSGTRFRRNRTKGVFSQIIKNYNHFEDFHDFNHFYVLFEFSSKRQLKMNDMEKIMMELCNLFHLYDETIPYESFFAAEARKDFGNSLRIKILAGR